MIIRRLVIGLAACAALLAAGCGGGGDDGGSDQLATLAPAAAPLYLESVIRPQGEQSDAIDSLASRVGGIEDPGTLIVERLDAGLSQSGADVTYADDIAPWLGDRAAIFFQSLSGDTSDFAVVFETTDTAAAQDFIGKATSSSSGTQQGNYNGVDYFQDAQGSYAAGVVGDFLVFGSLDAFKAAVDAANGSSLEDSSDFQDGVSAVSADNIGLGYVDSSQAIQAATATMNPFEAQALKPLLDTLGSGPATFSVSATPDEASLDVSVASGSAPELAGGDLVGMAPGDSWFALGLTGLGEAARGALDSVPSIPGVGSVESQIQQATGVDPRDALSWMRQGYGFVAGTSEKTIAGGIVISSSDTGESAKSISQLRDRAQADVDAKLGPPPPGADEGFSVSAPESPETVQVGQFGNQVVAALGPGQAAQNALHPGESLADDPSFQAGDDALGSGFSPLAFVSLKPFFVVAEKGGSASDPGYLAAKPYLQKLDYLMLGTSSDQGRTTLRFAVGVG